MYPALPFTSEKHSQLYLFGFFTALSSMGDQTLVISLFLLVYSNLFPGLHFFPDWLAQYAGV